MGRCMIVFSMGTSLDRTRSPDERAAFTGCWAATKIRYNVAKYEHIPASRFANYIACAKRTYAQITGETLLVMTHTNDV